MKRTDRKSDCAINHSLEVMGDPWSFLIIRDMVTFGKKTYGEFLASDERIGTSVLARRLAELKKHDIITKEPSQHDGRKDEYFLTEKGIALIPILNELAVWGAAHDPATGANKKVIAKYQADRQGVIDRTQEILRNGGSVVQNLGAIYNQ